MKLKVKLTFPGGIRNVVNDCAAVVGEVIGVVNMGEGRLWVINLGIRGVMGFGGVFLKPVVAEPGRGMDEIPPLVGEVLHLTISQRHKDRSIGIKG